MAGLWDPIDPQDIVDLWVNCGGAKPFLPATELITVAVVTVPAEVIKVTSSVDPDGKKIRVRVGPCQSGSHEIHYHITTDTGQQFDFDVPLEVKERIKT